MTRINVYDRSEVGTGGLIGWFNRDACTDVVQEDTQWNEQSGNRIGVISGLQVGYEELLRTAQGRWVRHYDSSREYAGPEFYEFLTDTEARTWLIRNNDADSEKVLAKYFGEPEEEAGPSAGGRPAVGPPISVAFPVDLLARIDAAASAAGIKRAAWLRQAAETALA
jgi:hypothetical protein